MPERRNPIIARCPVCRKRQPFVIVRVVRGASSAARWQCKVCGYERSAVRKKR